MDEGHVGIVAAIGVFVLGAIAIGSLVYLQTAEPGGAAPADQGPDRAVDLWSTGERLWVEIQMGEPFRLGNATVIRGGQELRTCLPDGDCRPSIMVRTGDRLVAECPEPGTVETAIQIHREIVDRASLRCAGGSG